MTDAVSQLEIWSVVGARPQFVKLAPMVRAVERHQRGEIAANTKVGPSLHEESTSSPVRLTHRILHTGQHYDPQLSSVFFDELELPDPDVHLATGSGSHGAQTGAMLAAIEAECMTRRPDVVLVYGDTNSTLAAALAACKLDIPVAHVESGLRSFDRGMPEEINRRLVDHCSDRLYAPTPTAAANLRDEGLASRCVVTGDINHDAVLHGLERARRLSHVLEQHALEEGAYAVLTMHRAENTGRETLEEWLTLLDTVASGRCPLILPVHPRIASALSDLTGRFTSLRCIDPLSWFDMLRLVDGATLVLTDSGGLQKEAAFLGVPCITLRSTSEWLETVDLGINRLVARDLVELEHAFDAVLSATTPFPASTRTALEAVFGRGDAAELILADLIDWLDATACKADDALALRQASNPGDKAKAEMENR